MNNTNNPNGYRSDDPRYGLSGKKLTQYYQNQPPHYLIKTLYKHNIGSHLKSNEDKYQDHVISHLSSIHFSGRLITDNSSETKGIICIIDAPDKDTAKSYIKSNIYNHSGLLEEPRITRFISSKKLRYMDRILDPDKQLFICECIDGPEAIERRKQSSTAHHKYQGKIIDKYIAHGPLRNDENTQLIGSLFIIEVEDRDSAYELIHNEPMVKNDVFKTVEITRWCSDSFLRKNY